MRMNKKMNSKVILTIIFCAILITCEKDIQISERKVFPRDAIINTHNINDLNVEELFYYSQWIYPLDTDYLRDSNNVSMFNFNGVDYYHPVQLAQRTLAFIDSYHKTEDYEYLVRANAHADKLISISTELNNAVYFYYLFDFPLHGYQDQVMNSPWYSCMAQRQALSAFCRLYKVTQNENYLLTAAKIFNSFFNVDNLSDPWIAFIDSNNFYWMEEYPLDGQNYTQALNGFIFGVYGIYDYYVLTNRQHGSQILLASLTTLKKYLENYREPGEISYYCLRHKVQSDRYHKVHIDQLQTLYKITSDIYFKELADKFMSDTY